MFYWSFTSLVQFWPPPIFNPGYAYGTSRVADPPQTWRSSRGTAPGGQTTRVEVVVRLASTATRDPLTLT